MAAANKTVRDDVKLHSLHCYFLLAGDPTVPIIYHVERVRDGGSYVTRSVHANQRGRCIFTMILSYQKPEPQQPRFALPAPTLNEAGTYLTISHAPEYAVGQTSNTNINANVLPQPEDCPPNEERYQAVVNRPGIDPKVKYILEGWIDDRKNSPVEIRYVLSIKLSYSNDADRYAHLLCLFSSISDALPDMYDENGHTTPGNHQAFWIRTRKPMSGGPEAQKIALSYSSE